MSAGRNRSKETRVKNAHKRQAAAFRLSRIVKRAKRFRKVWDEYWRGERDEWPQAGKDW